MSTATTPWLRPVIIFGALALVMGVGILLVLLAARDDGDDPPTDAPQPAPTAEATPTSAATTVIAIPPGMPTPACSGPAADRSSVSWHPDFLRIDGRKYTFPGLVRVGATVVDDSVSGPQVGEILWNVTDSWTEPCHADLDGSSSIVLAKSPVFAMKGYRPEFRVLAPISRELHIFESGWHDDATTIEELLDIRGKVLRATVIQLHTDAEGGGRTWTLTDSAQVTAFVDRLLAEPLVVPTSGPRAADMQLRTEFELQDGTTVARMWISMPPRPDAPIIPASQDFMRSLIAFLEASP